MHSQERTSLPKTHQTGNDSVLGFDCILTLDLWTLCELSKHWSTASSGAVALSFKNKVQRLTFIELRALNKVHFTAMIEVLAEHGYISTHEVRLKFLDDANCQSCW